MNSKQKGDLSELKLLTVLTEKGYIVSIPWGDTSRYDLVFEESRGVFRRVQVKTGRLRNGCVVFNGYSVNYRTQQSENYLGQIDYFGIYCPDNNSCYLVSVGEAGKRGTCLRVNERIGTGGPKSKMAVDYLIS